MHQHMQQLPKQVILLSLKGIPPYARPPYCSSSICASSSALVTHILSCIQYLCSLDPIQFFQVFFSVLPFDMWYQDPWDALIECLLTVEYGNDIITHLSMP